jgi:hypothetical protein
VSIHVKLAAIKIRSGFQLVEARGAPGDVQKVEDVIMFKRSLGIAVLALVGLVAPTVASARDHDDRYRGNRYGWNSKYERERLKAQRRAQREWEREQRARARYQSRYGNGSYYRNNPFSGYSGTYRNGYYDRYGIWRPYYR